MIEPGKFIVLEGGEACGKSTQARLLAERIGAVLTREPGGTDIGEAIRLLLLDPSHKAMSSRAEALLMLAARAQHVDEVVRPNLEAGRHVVSDRYAGSSLVYQGLARGLGVNKMRDLSSWATRELRPDVTLLIDVPREVAKRRRGDSGADRLESAGEDFHLRVQDGFRRLAKEEGWITVDGTASVDEVAGEVFAVVEPILSGEDA